MAEKEWEVKSHSIHEMDPFDLPIFWKKLAINFLKLHLKSES